MTLRERLAAALPAAGPGRLIIALWESASAAVLYGEDSRRAEVRVTDSGRWTVARGTEDDVGSPEPSTPEAAFPSAFDWVAPKNRAASCDSA